jgi:hypothetical protein
MFIAVLTASGLFAQSGTIKGKVFDADTGEPMPFANVSVVKDGEIITGGMTDFDGVYQIKPVPVGRFTVKASTMGYKTVAFSNVQINNSKITFQDFKLPSSVSKLEEVVVKEYKVPLISKDQVESGGTVTQEDIDKMPGRSAQAVASTVGGVTDDGSGNLSVRGARSEGTVYYVDGVRVMGNTLPKSAIEQINVITGGLAAKYGDATGGIINITTKGASKDFHGGLELVTSQYLDPYGQSIANLTLTGPLFFKKTVDPYDSTKVKKKPIVGFLVTGEVSYSKDQSPSINDMWVANDGVRESILETPYVVTETANGPIVTYSSDYFYDDKFHTEDSRRNNSSLSLNTSGKLTFNLSDGLIFSLGGRYRFIDRDVLSFANIPFNSQNNGHFRYSNWQVNGRLTHKLSQQTASEEKKSSSVLKNVFYSLVGSYEKMDSKSYNDNFDDDFFKYGHVGKFTTYKAPTYEWTEQLEDYPHGIYAMNAIADTLVSFSPSQYNKELAAYTDYYYSLFDQSSFFYRNQNNIEAYGGVLNGQNPESVYGMFNSPGTPYNGYNIGDNSQFILSGNGSADIGDHVFEVGFEFEQRDQRSYGVNPRGLWSRARDLANFHISELDLDNPIRHYIVDADGNEIPMDTLSYNRLYSPGAQTMFDYKFREYLASKNATVNGEQVTVDGTQWLDIDSYDPSDLSIDYFSADELLNEGNSSVSYFGYDAYGNRLTDNPTLEDFFTETNDLGYKTRPIASFRPNYLAFYIQDKFAFDDLIFRIGLRADRYDANQQVLKDAYSFNQTLSVADVQASNYSELISSLPSNIGDDYVVYANDINIANASTILGYRTGDNPADIRWYNAQGTQITDPKEISSATGIAPLLQNPVTIDSEGEEVDIPDLSKNDFKDYIPQWNFMPRIAFSFPISDVALFSANYDVMTKRPFGVNRMNPIEYLHIQSFAGNPINNPNLMPEKTIEYALGFQQKVSNTSSIKITAFYREKRDEAQVQNITGAYPMNYITYQNIDFGTIKGLTVNYDLRRTGNIRMNVNYTLQFANGTGSNASTALSLIKQNEPNLRQTLPLNIDPRHSIKGSIDYSYLSGKAYTGPKMFGKDLLQNTGVTFIAMYNTGNPYSKQDPRTSYLVGSVNGSRMPSIFKIDMKLYRDFLLNQGKDKKNPMGLKVYLDVFNLFNTFNVASVYRTTGNPDDDAYLTTARYQPEINNNVDPYAYRNYYSMRLAMSAMYMAPRTVRLGMLLTF